jgi:hypothetical protein
MEARAQDVELEVPVASGKFGMVPREVVTARLSGRARHVFDALALYANGNRKAWPSQATLAEVTNLSRWQVREALNELKRGGWIRIEQRSVPRVHGGWTRTSAMITLYPFGRVGDPPEDMSAPPQPLAEPEADDRQRSGRRAREGAANGRAVPPHNGRQERTSGTDQEDEQTTSGGRRNAALEELAEEVFPAL